MSDAGKGHPRRRSAGGAETLPGEYYTAEGIFQRELERIFYRRWLYAGRSAQLAEPGSYALFELGPESLIVLRDGDGEVRAFYNVCRHRGTRLCTKPGGRFRRAITCPYHAWVYALDGRLTGAPNMGSVKGFRKADYPLHAVRVAHWEGGIFVNFAHRPEPFENAFAAGLSRFRAWRLNELRVAHEVTYDVAANWKLILQNYSECYHCPTLHPQLNRLTPYRDSSNDLEEGTILGGPMRLAEPFESMTESGRACAPPLVSGAARRCVYYYVVFPNLLLSLHPDYVLVHRLLPQAVDRTTVVCTWLFHPEALARPDFDPGDAIAFWNTTNLQDWEVCELSQQGVASRAYTPGPYADLESMIAALDRTYLAALEA